MTALGGDPKRRPTTWTPSHGVLALTWGIIIVILLGTIGAIVTHDPEAQARELFAAVGIPIQVIECNRYASQTCTVRSGGVVYLVQCTPVGGCRINGSYPVAPGVIPAEGSR